MWAGIGGTPNGGYIDVNRSNIAWLEQAGITIECANKKAQPVYQPFWEVVPSPHSPVTDEYPSRDLYSNNAYVHAGDEITVVVVPPSTTEAAVTDAWTFAVTDYNFTTGAIVTWTHHDPNLPSALYGLSADAITECTPGFGCPYLGNGTVTFDSADYTDTSGESYSIAGASSTAAYLEHPDPGPVAIYPGAPYGDLNDSFDLFYTSYWWR
jgi:hypothetical protein